MGMFKNGIFWAARRTISPAKSLIVPQVREQFKSDAAALKNTDTLAPVCPNCAAARLIKNDNPNDSLPKNSAEWECPQCEFNIDVDGQSTDDLKEWLVHNAKEVYQNSLIHEELYGDSEADAARYTQVKKRVLISRGFLTIAILFSIFFIYACFKHNFILMFNTALMAFSFIFIGAANGYRAWQIEHDRLFAKNGKAQFHYWLRNYNWFALPNRVDTD